MKGPTEPQPKCPTCGATFVGAFCHACGERRLRPGEFTFVFWTRALIARLTQVDGPFAKALTSMLRRPGELSHAYFAGRRVPFARPIQFFLLANVVYFLVGSWLRIDTLATHLTTHITDQASLHRAAAKAWVDGRLGVDVASLLDGSADAAARQAFADLKRSFDARGRDLSKSLVFVLVPLFFLASLASLALGRRQRRRMLSEHFVASLHFVSYFMLVQVIVVAAFLVATLPTQWLGMPQVRAFLMHDRALGPALAIMLAWYGYGLGRRFYGFGRFGGVITSVLTLVASLAALVVYRAILFFATAATA